MKDGIFRKIIKRIVLVISSIDLGISRFWRKMQGEKPYKLGGNCALCAQCCESPMIQTSSLFFRLPSLKALFLLWHRHINGFELIREIPLQRIFVFNCTHFNPETRRCDSYSSRPLMCRDYPRTLLWEAEPPFLPKCGYKAISPNADKISELLKKENIDPEKMEEVKKKMHL